MKSASGKTVSPWMGVGLQYTHLFTSGDEASEAGIAPGAGAAVRAGAIKLAVTGAPKGVVHRLSAVCPHLGCIVAWNGVESTWDCPCHGSRFDCKRKGVNGPAMSNLEKARVGGGR